MTENFEHIARLRKSIALELGGMREYKKVKDRLGFSIQLSINEVLREKICENPRLADHVGQLHQYKDILNGNRKNSSEFLDQIDQQIHEQVKEILSIAEPQLV